VLGGPTIRGKVLWLGLEEHTGDVVQRFIELDADPDNIVIATQIQGMAGLEALVGGGEFMLATVDTLVALASGIVTDPFSSAQWQPLMQRTTNLAHKSGTCIVLLHHTAKRTGLYRDSTAIAAGVDVLCEMLVPSAGDSHGDTTTRILDVRGRGVSRTQTYVHLSSPGANTYELARSSKSSPDLEVYEWIVRNPGRSTREVEKGVGKRAQDVRQLLAELEEGRRIEDRSSGHGARRRRAWFPCART
jgi:hypothetical protein